LVGATGGTDGLSCFLTNMEWIDLALIGDEATLRAAISGLSNDERDAAIEGLADVLGVDDGEFMRGMLRILVERARPLALPSRLWRRSLTSSDDPARMAREHLVSRRLQPTPERVRLAVAMYSRFEEERDRTLRLTEDDLVACGYRCGHCGLEFHNEELESRSLESPFGNRFKLLVAPLKPHWNGPADMREPTMDHDWPVSLYGDNGHANLRVLCHGCNVGKRDVVALEQSRSWTGYPERPSLINAAPVEFPVFYAQLRREPLCWRSGRAADAAELTVELKDLGAPAVLDNLMTVAMP
jgi:hypothetical protein